MDTSIGLKDRFLSWRTLFSFVLAFIAIYLLVTKTDPDQIWLTVKETDYRWYLLAFIVYYSAFPVRAVRFRMMLRNNGVEPGLVDLSKILLISWFANCIVPAKMGDLYRGYLVKEKYGLPFMKTVGVIFVERVFDLLVLYCIIGVTGLISFRDRVPDALMSIMEVGFVLILVLILLTFCLKRFGHWGLQWIPARAEKLYGRFLSGTVDSLQDYGWLFFLTAIIWLLEGASFFLVAKAMQLELSLATVLFIALASALLTALPVTPAGLGIVEATKVGVLIFFGQSKGLAVSAALLDRIINYWSLILVGLVLYLNTVGKTKKGGVIGESYGSDSDI